MSILAGVLAAGRRQALARMTETVIAGSYTVAPDPTTLLDVSTLTATHYTGVARVKYPTMTVRDADAGDAQFAVSDITVSVPVTASVIPVGALITVSGSTVDTLLVGRVYRVKGAPQGGQTTAHRYPVTEQL